MESCAHARRGFRHSFTSTASSPLILNRCPPQSRIPCEAWWSSHFAPCPPCHRPAASRIRVVGGDRLRLLFGGLVRPLLKYRYQRVYFASRAWAAKASESQEPALHAAIKPTGVVVSAQSGRTLGRSLLQGGSKFFKQYWEKMNRQITERCVLRWEKNTETGFFSKANIVLLFLPLPSPLGSLFWVVGVVQRLALPSSRSTRR